MSPLLEAAAEGHADWNVELAAYLIGGGTLVFLMFLMFALLAFGKGREHC